MAVMRCAGGDVRESAPLTLRDLYMRFPTGSAASLIIIALAPLPPVARAQDLDLSAYRGKIVQFESWALLAHAMPPVFSLDE